MSPAKKNGKYVLTGRSRTMTFGLADSDETLVLERGVPADVPAEFKDSVEAESDVYPEGKVPEDAIVGPPKQEPGELDQPADEAPPEPAVGDSETTDATGEPPPEA